MADLSKVTLPSGTTYNFKDEYARQVIAGTIRTIEGECTTPLTDMATTNPITIDGEPYTATKNEATFYDHKEFVFDGTYWHEFGDLTGLGALALKDSASGTYTPAGTVSKPSVNVTPTTTTVNSITDVGTLPSLTMTVENENLTFGWNAGTLPMKGADTSVVTGATAELDAAPTFTGTAATITVG